MKTITSNLLKYLTIAAILTVLFRYSLTVGVNQHSSTVTILSASLYGISMFIAGWVFGKKERLHLPFYDVGFRFHLGTYIIHNLISELWFILGFNSKIENIEIIHLTAIIWGIGLFIHLILFLSKRKNSISNLDKASLFD